MGVAASTSSPVVSEGARDEVMRPIMAVTVELPLVSATLDEPRERRRVARVGLSRTHDGEVFPDATARTRRGLDLEDPFVGWTASIGVALLGLFLRLWKLGEPKAFSFDETYYAKDAWSLLRFGYARDYIGDADKAILGGQTTDLWKDTPSLAVHPDVGKWLIALGEKAFGMDPFGWRVSAAVVGALMILVMCRFVRRITGSTLLGCVGGLLLGFDGLHLVLSRLALLDIFLAFFILCAVHCLVADRDWFRRRMAARAVLDPGGRVAESQAWGPVRGLLLRPWLLAAGVCFGLAVGTKWTALYPLAAFGILVWVWSVGARRSFGVRQAWLRSALVDGVPAFFSLIGVGLVVYVATWTGLAGPRPRVRSLQHLELAVHAVRRRHPVADRDRAGRGGLRRGGAVAALVGALPARRLRLPHQVPQRLDAPVLVQAGRVAAAEPARRGRRPERHQARRAGVRGARGQHLPAPGAAAGQPGDLVGRLPRAPLGPPAVGGCARLEVRRRAGRGRVDLAALAAVRRPADLLVLRGGDAAVPGAGPDAGPRPAHRRRPRDPRHGAPSAWSWPAPSWS